MFLRIAETRLINDTGPQPALGRWVECMCAKKTVMSDIILSHAAAPLITEVEVTDERGRVSRTHIPAERPLTLYLDKRELVTLMTMGASPEALAVGYLRNQRFIHSIDDLASVQVDWEVESVAVTTKSGVDNIEEQIGRAHV